MQIPKPIENKLIELNQLIEQNPQFIPLTECAAFLGAKSDGLRTSIERGQCPFGISWQCVGAANRAFKIPTVTFYMWYTQGVACR
jgi:hypothetical protein